MTRTIVRNIGVFVFGAVTAFVGLLAWGDSGTDIEISAINGNSNNL